MIWPRNDTGLETQNGFPNRDTRGGSSRERSTESEGGGPGFDAGARDDRVRNDDRQERLRPGVMASAAVARKCFYGLQGVMTRQYGANEISTPFTCKRRRSSEECIQCAGCSRHFHHACNAELRQMFAHNPESETDVPVIEEGSVPIQAHVGASSASTQNESDRPVLCVICEASDLLQYASCLFSIRLRSDEV